MEHLGRLCAEKHRIVDRELTRHGKWLGEHEKKLDTLERSDASHSVQIETLTKAIAGQTKALWGLMTAIVAALGGFFVWYVQTLS